MTKQPKWRFPANDHGAWHDSQDASRAHFSKDPMTHLVRESLQNALDAANPGLDTVEVSIGIIEIPADSIDGKGLSRHLQSCQKEAELRDNKQAAESYTRGIVLLKESSVTTLTITDVGTTGLKDDNWVALVLSEGSVAKQLPAAGGSFGIGKNASYNVSDLNAVVYSTRYLDRRKGRVTKMQGRARLMTHSNPQRKGQIVQHIGFLELNRQSLYGIDIPEVFHLNETGTGVFVLGFNPHCDNWKTTAISAVVDSYAYAILHRRLVVTLTDTEGTATRIDHETIDSLFDQDDYRRHFYLAMRDAAPIPITGDDQLGRLDLYLQMGEGPRRIAYINRHGMLITDSRDTAVNPFAVRASGLWPDFAAVVVPQSDRGDHWVRRMENPSHDIIAVGHLEPEQQKVARASFQQVRAQLRQIIAEQVGSIEPGINSNVTELAPLFPDHSSLRTAEGELNIRPTIAFPPNHSRNSGRSSPIGGEVQLTPVKSPRIIPRSPRTAHVLLTTLAAGPTTIRLRPVGSDPLHSDTITIQEAVSEEPRGMDVEIEHDLLRFEAPAQQRVHLVVTANRTIEARALRLN